MPSPSPPARAMERAPLRPPWAPRAASPWLVAAHAARAPAPSAGPPRWRAHAPAGCDGSAPRRRFRWRAGAAVRPRRGSQRQPPVARIAALALAALDRLVARRAGGMLGEALDA